MNRSVFLFLWCPLRYQLQKVTPGSETIASDLPEPGMPRLFGFGSWETKRVAQPALGSQQLIDLGFFCLFWFGGFGPNETAQF